MADDDPYPLTRGKHQLIRVNSVQMLWRDTNGWLLHPVIGTDRPSLKVADVGTASGLWLCALDREYHGEKEFRGFDISATSFIPSNRLPPNVKLEVLDAMKPAPEELRGKFDVAHLRLLQPVVFKDDPEPFIAHCIELLKPGGYIQWEEYDPLAVEVHAGDKGAPNLLKLRETLQSRVPAGWVADLPNRMRALGLEVAAVERKKQLPWHTDIVTCNNCLVFEEFADTFLDINGPPGSGDAMRALSKAGLQELFEGSSVDYVFQTVVARKPE